MHRHRNLKAFGTLLSLWSTTQGFVLRPASHNTNYVATSLAAFEGTVVVCTAGNCSKKGGKKALAILEDLAAASDGKLAVETTSCVSDCAECALGPNVELRAKGDDGPFFPIKNKVKTEEDVKKILDLS